MKGRGKGRSEGCGGEEGGAELFFCTNFVLQATNALGTKLGAERKRRVGQEGRKGRKIYCSELMIHCSSLSGEK